jgi:hypothetical protein
MKGLAKMNTAWENYDELAVQANFEMVLLELRAFFSRQATANEIAIYIQTAPIADLNSKVEHEIKRPLPMDALATASQRIYLKGKTDGTATDFIIELVVDERPV